jgi:hypothetical protein
MTEVERYAEVDVYLGDTLLGSGIITYTDAFEPKPFDSYVDRCSTNNICIGESCFDIDFCYRDYLAKGLGGSDSYYVQADIYSGQDLIGSAYIPVTDSYSASAIAVALSLIPILASVSLLYALYKKRKR